MTGRKTSRLLAWAISIPIAVGPVIAAVLLTLAPMDLVFLGIDPNYGQVIQGTLIVLVVMVAGFSAYLQERK